MTTAAQTVPAAPAARVPRAMTRVLVVIVAMVAVLLALRLAVAEPFGIPSDSMAPALTQGDHVVVDKLAYRGGGTPATGDVIVFHAPGSGEIALKRVVAQPGQAVAIEDGVLRVDGTAPAEPYVADPDAIDSVYFGPVTVPRGSVFVLGDNRGDSVDSRAHGSVPASDVIGRVRARVWPPGRWGAVR
jgi:signal peptidase I